MVLLRAAPPLLLLSSLLGCQLISGIDDLESGSGGGGTTSSTSSTGGVTTGGACPMLQGGPCSSNEMMTCPVNCEQDVCKITCPDAPMCEGTMANPGDMVCGDPGGAKYPCVFDCGASVAPNCSNKRIICPTGSPRCDVICHGAGACVSTEIVCGDGECNLTCEMGACSAETVMRCSKGPCKVTCNAPADFVKPTIENAGASCAPDFSGCP